MVLMEIPWLNPMKIVLKEEIFKWNISILAMYLVIDVESEHHYQASYSLKILKVKILLLDIRASWTFAEEMGGHLKW